MDGLIASPQRRRNLNHAQIGFPLAGRGLLFNIQMSILALSLLPWCYKIWLGWRELRPSLCYQQRCYCSPRKTWWAAKYLRTDEGMWTGKTGCRSFISAVKISQPLPHIPSRHFFLPFVPTSLLFSPHAVPKGRKIKPITLSRGAIKRFAYLHLYRWARVPGGYPRVRRCPSPHPARPQPPTCAPGWHTNAETSVKK